MSGPSGSAPAAELHTTRLRLRHLAEEDAAGLHEAFGDAATMRYWDSPPTTDVAATAERMRASRSAHIAVHAAFAVRTRTDGAFIGMVNYHARQAANRRPGVGWILLPRCRGRGHMTEAMAALLRPDWR